MNNINALYLIHTGIYDARGFIGGTQLHAAALAESGIHKNSYLLSYEEGVLVLEKANPPGKSYRLTFPVRRAGNALIRQQDYLEVYKMILRVYEIDLVHIHHLMNHTTAIITEARQLNIPIILTLHDFYTLCPVINLVDKDNKYCAGKINKKVCSECLTSRVSLEISFLTRWRQEFNNYLKMVDCLVAPSAFMLEIFKQFYEIKEARVIPHGTKLDLQSPPEISGPCFNVAFVGNLTEHKGSAAVKEIIKKTKDPDLVFHSFGKIADQELLDLPLQNFIRHGEYGHGELQGLMKKNNIHLVALLSNCPESFSLTLSESWQCSIPVIGTDLGAIGERISESGAGILVNVDNVVQQTIEAIEKMKNEPELYSYYVDQSGRAPQSSNEEMIMEYQELYDELNQLKQRRQAGFDELHSFFDYMFREGTTIKKGKEYDLVMKIVSAIKRGSIQHIMVLKSIKFPGKQRLKRFILRCLDAVGGNDGQSQDEQALPHYNYVPYLNQAPALRANGRLIALYNMEKNTADPAGNGLSNSSWLNPEIGNAKTYGLEGLSFYFQSFKNLQYCKNQLSNYLGAAGEGLQYCFCVNGKALAGLSDQQRVYSEATDNYSPANPYLFIESIKKCLAAEKYLKIRENPLILVDNPLLHSRTRQAADILRSIASESGINGICLASINPPQNFKPGDYGFDLQLESLDVNASPYKYQASLYKYLRDTRKDYAGTLERPLIINGWNQGSEGACLQPDNLKGYAYLEATRMAMVRNSAQQSSAALDPAAPVAIIIHVFYEEVMDEILSYLETVKKRPLKLYVTVTPANFSSVNDKLMKQKHPYEIFRVANRGRDILPFLKIMSRVLSDRYHYLVKIHTKKSLHRRDGHIWRRDVFNQLLTEGNLENMIDHLEKHRQIGILGPEGHVIPLRSYYGSNVPCVEWYTQRMGISKEVLQSVNFVAGSMFIARATAIEPLLNLAIGEEDFDEESGQIDGTLAHAIERLFPISALSSGMETTTISNRVTYNYKHV